MDLASNCSYNATDGTASPNENFLQFYNHTIRCKDPAAIFRTHDLLPPANLTLDILTLSFLLLVLWVVHSSIEIQHPVFAVLHQDLAVSALVKATMVALETLVLVWDRGLFPLWVPLNLLATWLLFLFHGCSWMVIAWQKFLLVARREVALDMDDSKFKRCSLVKVWLAFLLECIISSLVSTSVAISMGFPKVLGKFLNISTLTLD